MCLPDAESIKWTHGNSGRIHFHANGVRNLPGAKGGIMGKEKSQTKVVNLRIFPKHGVLEIE